MRRIISILMVAFVIKIAVIFTVARTALAIEHGVRKKDAVGEPGLVKKDSLQKENAGRGYARF